MSASVFVGFFGIRYEITISESEDENDPRVRAARKNGLQFYSGNFGGQAERYLLFIGSRLGILGAENRSEIVIAGRELQRVMESTREKLRTAGFEVEPALYLQWEEDV